MDNINKSEEIIDFFLNKNEVLKNISVDEIRDIMQLCMITLNAEENTQLQSKALTLLYHIAFLNSIELSEAWEIYRIIVNALFRSYQLTIVLGNIVDLYSHIYHRLKQLIILPRPYIPLNQRNRDKVVVMTSQFLGIGHAPTTRVLDYSYALQKELNKQVIIINVSLTNMIHNKALEPSVHLAYIEQLNKIQYLQYKDEQFQFYQIDKQMPDVPTIQRLIDIIYEENPFYVFDIGASNLVCDLCTNFTTTVCMPCSTSIPVSLSEFLLVGHQINQNDRERIDKMESYQSTIETIFNFKMSEGDLIYTREQFGISKESFLIVVVGNRLEAEMDQYFYDLLKRILKEEKVQLLFIGSIEDEQSIREVIGYSNRIFFSGSIKDASNTTKLADVYINPKRSGGGRSSFEALYYGVPVLTLKYGDVYDIVGDTFAVDSYDDMYQSVKSYLADRIAYETMKSKALGRANELGDITGTHRKIMDYIISKSH